MERDANEHGVQFTRAELCSLFNQVEDNDSMQVVNLDGIM